MITNEPPRFQSAVARVARLAADAARPVPHIVSGVSRAILVGSNAAEWLRALCDDLRND